MSWARDGRRSDWDSDLGATWSEADSQSWRSPASWQDLGSAEGQWAARIPSKDGEEQVGSSRRRVVLIVGLVLLILAMALSMAYALLPSAPTDVRPTAPSAAPEPVQSAQPTEAEPSEVLLPRGAVVATVVAVIDGDTIDTDAGRVRFFGIDTPERGAPYSDEATAFVAKAIPVGATVWIWRAPGSDDVDGYDRLVRVVLTEVGTDLNAALVGAGLARAYVRYSDRYLPEEGWARSDRLGIWSSAAPEEPAAVDETPTARGGLESEPWNLPGPDLDCSDIGAPVRVLPPDYHRLDRDGDGWGCER